MTRGPTPLTRGRLLSLLPLTMLVLTLLYINFYHPVFATASIRGVVQDDDGSPIGGAQVTLWLEREFITSSVTESDGQFEIEVEDDELYTLYVFADDEATPGVDYMPSRNTVAPSDVEETILTLTPAASLILVGDIQFVESEELPFSTLYTVQELSTGLMLEREGFPLIYGSVQESQSYFLGLEPFHIIVPAGEAFTVEVNSTVFIESDIVTRSFEVDDPPILPLNLGEQVFLDVRRYSVPSNLATVETLIDNVEERLDEMDIYGFYLTTERMATTSATRWLSEARYLFDEGRYIDSFGACKMAYLELMQTQVHLATVLGNASISVYSIIAFLALTSTTIAFLLSNRNSTKILCSITVYAATLTILYYTYPGSVLVPTELFVFSGVISLSISLIAALIFPRFMRGRSGDGHVPVRNIIVPIFSMAKRSIRRRRLRFALTLISITFLVMSFVSLTSFSEGYGLIVSRVSNRALPLDGVLLRAEGYTEMDPTHLPERDVASGWLKRQPESAVVSPKAENLPLTRSKNTLNGLPIWGVLGFDPSYEIVIAEIADALEEGELPSEGGVVISEALREMLGVALGDSLVLNGMQVSLDGILDDDALQRLKELDDSSYLPGKLVNMNPEGEIPQFALRPCEASEVVIVHLSNALKMPLVGISRVAITVTEGVDTVAFAERLALERGYWAWSASAEGVHLARIGSYLEGKGLPLMIPWGIVVLNVVVTMLNSMYERRREIQILSSVGLNPAQISAIFVAEASIIGLTAGGVGYLTGLGLYRGMAFLSLTLEVQQKVSAFWSLASIGIAMTAVLIGAFAALRSSVVITPSLMRRWRIEHRPSELFEHWQITIPLRLHPYEVNEFVNFTVHALEAMEDDPVRCTSSIKILDKAEAEVRIHFIYKATHATARNFYTKNTLIIERGPIEGEASMKLRSYGEQEWAHTAGSLIRMIAMRWSTSKQKLSASRS